MRHLLLTLSLLTLSLLTSGGAIADGTCTSPAPALETSYYPSGLVKKIELRRPLSPCLGAREFYPQFYPIQNPALASGQLKVSSIEYYDQPGLHIKALEAPELLYQKYVLPAALETQNVLVNLFGSRGPTLFYPNGQIQRLQLWTRDLHIYLKHAPRRMTFGGEYLILDQDGGVLEIRVSDGY